MKLLEPMKLLQSVKLLQSMKLRTSSHEAALHKVADYFQPYSIIYEYGSKL